MGGHRTTDWGLPVPENRGSPVKTEEGKCCYDSLVLLTPGRRHARGKGSNGVSDVRSGSEPSTTEKGPYTFRGRRGGSTTVNGRR